MQCRICENEKGNRLFKFKEMHIGLREEFTYFQCVNCRCIQIEEIPENMSKYYPSDYYSFNLSPKSENVVKRAVRRQGDYYALFNRGFIGGFCLFGAHVPWSFVQKQTQFIGIRESSNYGI